LKNNREKISIKISIFSGVQGRQSEQNSCGGLKGARQRSTDWLGRKDKMRVYVNFCHCLFVSADAFIAYYITKNYKKEVGSAHKHAIPLQSLMIQPPLLFLPDYHPRFHHHAPLLLPIAT